MTTKTRKLANIGNDYFESLAGGPLSGLRNVIINGNFDIWQRGTSLSSGVASRFLADRWFNSSIGTTYTASRQTFTVGQTDVPYEPKYFHRTVVTSVAGASNYCELVQYIEDVRTLSNRNVTVSFYAKADAAKPITAEIYQHFGTGGSPSAGVGGIGATKFNLTTTWQKFTLTAAIPSISGKVLGTNNNDAFTINFWFDSGSTYNSRSATLGQQSGTFDIAQVQIEPGTIATPFEQRHMGIEVKLCQRYYEKSYPLDIAPGTASVPGNLCAYFDNIPSNPNYIGLVNYNFVTRKRATPAMAYYSLVTGAAGAAYDYVTATDVTAVSANVGTAGGRTWFQRAAAGSGYNFQFHFTADAELI